MKAKFLKDTNVHREMYRLFAQHDIPSQRIELLAWTTEVRQHMEIYHRVDISLDPFPFNGGTTSYESLCMGVPLVTLAGNNFVSRMGIRQLMNVGLSHLIARTPDEYVDIAVRLAGDLNQLKQLRAKLRTRILQSPLTDGKRLARNLEATYRTMWRRWCERTA